ncbi:hypothetical protein [Flavobacterium sp.]|uniref:hypothetical protein n=1 Tax=Flavobacterium sp. TaxID=239 RepID=UPI00375148CE
MKKPLKKFKIFLYLILATFLYYSCTQEKEYINGQNRINFDLKEKSLKEALDMPVFSTAYSKLTKKKFSSTTSETARTALEDQFGFTIVTDEPVRIITHADGTTFFTLLIEREVKEELKFENLIIRVKDGETVAAIIKYFMNEKAVRVEEHDSYKMTFNEKEFTDLNIEGRTFWSTTPGGAECITTQEVLCSDLTGQEHEIHVANSNCFYHAFLNGFAFITFSDSTFCFPNVIGGENVSTSSSSSTSTFNSSGGFNSNILETVLPCHTANCIEADSTETPCDRLKRLTAHDLAADGLKGKLVALRPKTNTGREYGFGLEYKNSIDKYTNIDVPINPNDYNMIMSEYGGYIFGAAHNHGVNDKPVPGFGDIRFLNVMYEEPNTRDYNRPNLVTYVVVRNHVSSTPATFTYALMIDNQILLKNKIDLDMNSLPASWDVMRKLKSILEADSKYYGDDSSTYEQKFLAKYGNYGFTLYKAADDNFTNWNKIKLEGGIVITIPCP